MTSTLIEFKRGIYEEHLEEVSFLYQQRVSMLADPHQPWMATEPFEDRLEAHLDALVLGATDAMQLCRERSAGGDAGDVFALTALACRLRDAHAFASILEQVEADAALRTRAVADALEQELPQPWHLHLVTALQNAGPRLLPILAQVAGSRRLPAAAVVADVLRHASGVGILHLLWAAGRVRGDACLETVRLRYADPNAGIQRAALRAGLRMHDDEARDRIVTAPLESASAVLLGLCGDQRAAEPLCRLLVARPVPSAAIALGLLGDASALPHLLSTLAQSDSASPTAQMLTQALFLITGALLFEDMLEPEPVAEDELFERELAAYQERGERPRRTDGRLFGPVVRRLSTDAAMWSDWLGKHGEQFKALRRYRFGLPDVLASARAGLLSGVISRPVRDLLIDESVVRHGVDLGVETSMPVALQCKMLRPDPGVLHADRPLEPGSWCFGSRPCLATGVHQSVAIAPAVNTPRS